MRYARKAFQTNPKPDTATKLLLTFFNYWTWKHRQHVFLLFTQHRQMPYTVLWDFRCYGQTYKTTRSWWHIVKMTTHSKDDHTWYRWSHKVRMITQGMNDQTQCLIYDHETSYAVNHCIGVTVICLGVTTYYLTLSIMPWVVMSIDVSHALLSVTPVPVILHVLIWLKWCDITCADTWRVGLCRMSCNVNAKWYQM